MSEALAPPHDDDVAIMAAELAKRRRRVVLLNLAILILPLLAGAVFLLFGRSDRAWVRDTVAESVTASVPEKVEATVEKVVPAKVEAALAQGVAPTVKRVLAQERVGERLALLERGSPLSADGFARKEDIDAVNVELKGRLDALQNQLNGQKLEIQKQKDRIDELEPLRSHLAQAIQHLASAERTLQEVLDQPLPDIPGIDETKVKESLLGDILKAQQQLGQLREALQAAQD